MGENSVHALCDIFRESGAKSGRVAIGEGAQGVLMVVLTGQLAIEAVADDTHAGTEAEPQMLGQFQKDRRIGGPVDREVEIPVRPHVHRGIAGQDRLCHLGVDGGETVLQCGSAGAEGGQLCQFALDRDAGGSGVPTGYPR